MRDVTWRCREGGNEGPPWKDTVQRREVTEMGRGGGIQRILGGLKYEVMRALRWEGRKGGNQQWCKAGAEGTGPDREGLGEAGSKWTVTGADRRGDGESGNTEVLGPQR